MESFGDDGKSTAGGSCLNCPGNCNLNCNLNNCLDKLVPPVCEPFVFRTCPTTDTCITEKYQDTFCMEGTSQTEFPPCQIVEETIGKGDSIEKSKEKTCACGTITKKFDIEGCITVTEAIKKDISSGSNA